MGKCLSSFKNRKITLQVLNETNRELKLKFYYLEHEIKNSKKIKQDIIQSPITIPNYITSIKVYTKNESGNYIFNQEYFSPFDENENVVISLNELIL